jgi:hypothetical protein
MADKIQKIFKDTLDTTLETGRINEFRLCIDEKDNISIAQTGRFFPGCHVNTKKIIDVVIMPRMVI